MCPSVNNFNIHTETRLRLQRKANCLGELICETLGKKNNSKPLGTIRLLSAEEQKLEKEGLRSQHIVHFLPWSHSGFSGM